jgi:ornithine cyclodeaminase/alanine dehydrogenase-like protein (mu-crystallin family)
MTLLVLSAADVHALLGYSECAEAMRGALTALATGQAQQPLRTVLHPDGAAGLVGLMPAYVGGDEARYGLKAVCVTPANPAAGLDAHQGIILLSSGRTGEPLAVVN